MKPVRDLIRKVVEEENFGEFDTERVVDFIEKYTARYKGRYLFDNVMSKHTGITELQALHVLCELRNNGVMTEEFRLICNNCFHPDNNTVTESNEEIIRIKEDFECNNCSNTGAYIQLMYRFKE